MKKLAVFLFILVFISPPIVQFASADRADGMDLDKPFSPESIERNLEGPIDAEDIAAVSSWASASGVADWLGPLAPVALSPFFGVTLLSGLSLWGPSWISDNPVLSSAGPLGHEWLFGIFLLLTLLTSLPRLTKVSKPFAQAVDRLETYAVIVILLAIKLVMSMDSAGQESIAALQVPVMQFGVVSFTLDTLLSIAMIVNILVINSVKFFFEFLVWLTPVPFLDAIFEVSNKSLCAMLMAIYAYSPTLATGINFVLLLIAALMLRWISRRVRFYRTMLLDPILAKLWTGFGTPKRPELIVFPQQDCGPFPAKSRLKLLSTADGMTLSNATWWLPEKSHLFVAECKPKIRRGWVMHTIEVTESGNTTELKFSRRYNDAELVKLLTRLGIEHDAAQQAVQADRSAEFA